MKLKEIGYNRIKYEKYEKLDKNLLNRYRDNEFPSPVLQTILEKLCVKNENGDIIDFVIFEEIHGKCYQDVIINIYSDYINKITINERLIRSLVDIFIENFCEKNQMDICEINRTGNILRENVLSYVGKFNCFRKIIVNYKIFGNTNDEDEDIYNEPKIEWNVEDDFPSVACDLMNCIIKIFFHLHLS